MRVAGSGIFADYDRFIPDLSDGRDISEAYESLGGPQACGNSATAEVARGVCQVPAWKLVCFLHPPWRAKTCRVVATCSDTKHFGQGRGPGGER